MTDSELLSNLDFDSLIYKINRGENLSENEKSLLVEFIKYQIHAPKEKRSLEDLFAAASVIKKSNQRDLAFLLELCLEVSDPLVVCLALETLCGEWGLTKEYKERLIYFSLGSTFDHDGDISDLAKVYLKSLKKVA